jgi:hypothetical protein
LLANDDLVAQATTSSDEVFFESPLIEGIAVRSILDRRGELGLVAALQTEGHLSSIQAVAQEALESVASWVRKDPSMREVLAQLDADEGESLVSTIATQLLREACG